MKAAVLMEKQNIVIKEVPTPQIADDEVLIEVACIGVCGSDVHYYEHGRIGNYIVESPIILGHEVAGTVVAIGDKVSRVKVGDRVAIEPGVTCGKCDYCKQGRYNLCPKVEFMATPPYDGAWAEYVKSREDFLFVLPDELSFEDGALLEPLSVGVHALLRADVKPYQKVLITGLGPIGQLAAAAARLLGVHEIYGSDVVEFRRQLAKQQFFQDVCDPSQLADKVSEWTDGQGFDVIIESSGNDKAIASLPTQVKRGGKIVLVGLSANSQVSLNTNELVDREIDLYGVFRYANTYPKTMTLLKNNRIDLEPFITHRYSLDQIQDALNTAITQKDSSMKIMIYPKGY